jgi:hypothetical protein
VGRETKDDIAADRDRLTVERDAVLAIVLGVAQRDLAAEIGRLGLAGYLADDGPADVEHVSGEVEP